MKLATLRDGSRDGQLIVVSRDLAYAHLTSGIAGRLQQVLDDWNFLSPQLEDLSQTLNLGKARHAFAFDPKACMAPLPRAHQWAEAWPGGPEARLRQGAGDDLRGACDDARFADAAGDIACAPGLAAVAGDVPMGAAADVALEAVRLLMLACTWSLRPLEAAGRAGGAELLQAWPAPSFGPVAVTPDELGQAWRGGRAHLRLVWRLNGRHAPVVDTGAAMPVPFGPLIARLAAARRVRAGSLIGSGPLAAVGNVETGEPGLRIGDHVGIDMLGADGQSMFGGIAQVVAPAADEAPVQR